MYLFLPPYYFCFLLSDYFLRVTWFRSNKYMSLLSPFSLSLSSFCLPLSLLLSSFFCILFLSCLSNSAGKLKFHVFCLHISLSVCLAFVLEGVLLNSALCLIREVWMITSLYPSSHLHIHKIWLDLTRILSSKGCFQLLVQVI